MAAKIIQSVSAVAVAIYFLSFLGIVVANDFSVEGKVFCDTCRVGFVTKYSTDIAGAKVRIECRNITNGETTFTGEAVTDDKGAYKLAVHDDREEEICEVILVSSPVETCNETKHGRDRGRILLTRNNGMAGNVRFVNPLGFLQHDTLPNCAELIKQYVLWGN